MIRGRPAPWGALDVGRRDYFGNRIPAGTGFDVGAHEYRAGDTCR
jgi:hypothetical protein